jgi:hypothetical protein
MKQKIQEAINSGVGFLKNEQDKNIFFGFETIFPLVLILDCLNEVDSNKAKKISRRIKEILIKEKSKNWSFNYWLKDSSKRKSEPYPDDLDDTFCALAALIRFKKTIIKGKDLAKIINLLLICEKNEGGPYRTWIVPKEKSKNWSDTDLAVNSNTAYFLKLQKVKLKNLNNFIEDAIENNKIYSPYYKGELPVLYFISRFYKGRYKKTLKQKLTKYLSAESSSLTLALAISSLIKLGYHIKTDWVKTLISKQSKSGSWPDEDFYYYKEKGQSRKFIGSKSISTAFVLETISLICKSESKDRTIKEISNFQNSIKKAVRNKFKHYPVELRDEIDLLITKITKKDKYGTASMMPFWVHKSLLIKNKKKINNNLLLRLCQNSLLGWCSFFLYDQIIDENNKSEFLPLANILCREMEIDFLELPIDKETGFFDLYKKIMQEMELCNWNELQKLRFNWDKNNLKMKKFNFDYLGKRSMGYALSSIAIFCHLGLNINSAEVRKLLNFFRYFIIAKQMNDDSHDWFEDLKKCNINSANYYIIKKYNGNLNKLKNAMTRQESIKKEFWETVIPNFCLKIVGYSNKAKENLMGIKMIRKEYLVKLNKKNITIAKTALNERNQALEFINHYY